MKAKLKLAVSLLMMTLLTAVLFRPAPVKAYVDDSTLGKDCPDFTNDETYCAGGEGNCLETVEIVIKRK